MLYSLFMLHGRAVTFTYLLTGLLLLLLVSGCRQGEQPPPPSPSGPVSFLLITLDTLRADRLGCYGYQAASTPNLDRFASEGVRFENAVSQVPLTLPSHATMMTGRFPMGHGVRDNGTYRLAPEQITLAEMLSEAGYETAAFVSSFVIDSRFGLDQGFDTFTDFDEEPGAGARAMRALSEVQRRGGDTAREALDWLSRPRSSPFFLWVHLYDPHYPFEPPEPYRSRFPTDPYDGEVAYTDAVVGSILSRLGELGLGDDTLVVIAGDHGESLGEHGEELHSWFIYDSVLKVPFLARLPGRVTEGLVIDEQVRLADLAPTALELLGLSRSDTFQGTSVAKWLTGEQAPVELPAYSESLVANLQFGWGELKALRSGGFKLIRAPRPELYDVRLDPGETKNLIAQRASTARSLLEDLEAMERRFEAEDASKSRIGSEIDAETARRLESLGYVSGGVAATEESARIDPKDKIRFFRRFNNELWRGTDAVDGARPDAAIAILRPLAEEVPTHSRVHHLLGRAYFDKGDLRGAIGEFEIVIGLQPDFMQARANLAQSYVLAGRPGDAERILREKLVDQPDNALLLFNLGFAYHRQNKLEQAGTTYEKALKVGDAHPQLLANLAMLYVQTERGAEAVGLFENLVELQPEDALAWNNLGLARAMAGRLPEAGAAFQRAAELAPENVAFRKNLALWLERSGQHRAAKRERERIEAAERRRPR